MDGPRSPEGDGPPPSPPGSPPPDPSVARAAAVKERPWDFDAWMAVIQPLEKASEGAPGAQRELRDAYEGFLREFPLCYGYWDKLARLERDLCVASATGHDGQAAPFETAAHVYERGISAVKCWELWLKYCQCAVQNCGDPNHGALPGSEAPQEAREQTMQERLTRSLFARATSEVGNVFDSCKLWNAWHAFEHARMKDVLIDGIVMPRQARLAEVAIRAAGATIKSIYSAKFLEIFYEQCAEGDVVKIASVVRPHLLEEDQAAVQELLTQLEAQDSVPAHQLQVALRKAALGLHSKGKDKSSALAPYEEAVTGATGRSYFHVKPLSDSQKAAWHDYISFALTQRADNTDFVVSIFERAMIACAAYPEFWLRYAAYFESTSQLDRASAVLEGASRSHIKRKNQRHVALMLQRALLAEAQGDADTARQLLCETLAGTPSQRDDENDPVPLVEVVLQLVNLERRLLATAGADCSRSARGWDACLRVYSENVDRFLRLRRWKEAAHVVMHQAAFLTQVARDVAGAREAYLNCLARLRTAASVSPSDDADVVRVVEVSVLQGYMSFEKTLGGPDKISSIRSSACATLDASNPLPPQLEAKLRMDLAQVEGDCGGDLPTIRGHLTLSQQALRATLLPYAGTSVVGQKRGPSDDDAGGDAKRHAPAPSTAQPTPAPQYAALPPPSTPWGQ